MSFDTQTDNAPAPVDQPGGEPQTPASWWDGFQDQKLKGMVQAKQWTNPEAMARSYLNLEQLHGRAVGEPDKVILLPKDPQDAEAMNAVWSKLGRPEKADGYQLPDHPQIPNNDPLREGFRGKAHELGLSKAQAEKVYSWYLEQQDALHGETRQQTEVEQQQQVDALKKEWGAAYQSREATARNAYQELSKSVGLNEEQLNKIESAIGAGALLKMFYHIGEKWQEDALPGANSPTRQFTKTPEQALYEIDSLKKDKAFMGRYLSKDADAIKTWKQLHLLAYPE